MSDKFSGQLQIVDDSGDIVAQYKFKGVDTGRWLSIEKERVTQFLDFTIKLLSIYMQEKAEEEANGD